MCSDSIRWHISSRIKGICALTLIVSEILTFQMFDLENLGQGTEYNVRNVRNVRWQIHKTSDLNAIVMFALPFAI